MGIRTLMQQMKLTLGEFVLLPGVLAPYYRGQTKFQLGSNRNLFDFTDNTNIAHAHCLATVKLHEQRNMLQLPRPDMSVDGEAFVVMKDEPCCFGDFTRRVWQLAGDKSRPDEIITIPRLPAMVIATLLEWTLWAVELGEPPLSRTKVPLSCMTRCFCIEMAKKRLGYAPVISLDDALTHGVRDCIRRREAEHDVLASEIESKAA